MTFRATVYAIVENSMNINQPTDITPKRTPLHPDIFSFLGWIMGGLSFLNLIRDLAPIKLYGLLAEWVGAYALLVKRLTDFLFGWIDWHWMNVTEAEGHVFILAIILASAGLRAELGLRKHKLSALRTSTPAVALFLSLVILPMIVIPGPVGVVAGALILGILSYLIIGGRGQSLRAVQAVRREILGVVAIFALIVVVNYTVFVPY